MTSSVLSFRTNAAAMRGQRDLSRTERSVSRSMGRLSSGLRINTAADDAAGLAISERLRAQVRGLAQAERNANDGISMLQTAEGALNEVSEMLIRMRELSVQAANGALGPEERSSLNDEFSALRTEIDRISDVTEFAGQKLIDGSLSAGVAFQVGLTGSVDDRITVTISDVDATAIGLSGAAIDSVTGAQAALDTLDSAIDSVTSTRGDLGAVQNRLISTIDALAVTRENLSAANSRIRDADIASESAELARSQILMQAGTAMLAQANQLPAIAMTLIG